MQTSVCPEQKEEEEEEEEQEEEQQSRKVANEGGKNDECVVQWRNAPPQQHSLKYCTNQRKERDAASAAGMPSL